MKRTFGIAFLFIFISSIALISLGKSDAIAMQTNLEGAEVSIDDAGIVDSVTNSYSALNDEEIRQAISTASSSAIIVYHGDTDEVQIIEPNIATYDNQVSIDPYIPEGLPIAPPPTQSHIIIDSDDRAQITAPTLNAYPYCAMAYLHVTYETGATGIASGCFVDEKKILTSAHVLYNANKGAAASVTIFPGGILSDFPSSTSSVFCLNSNYLQGVSLDYDYGVIIIEDSLGTGSLGMSSESDKALSNITLAGVYGYPEDKSPLGTLWYSSGTLSSILARSFCHNADTEGGQSGSPLFDMSNFYYVIGVHYGRYPLNPTKNAATRVTSNMVNFVNAC